MSVFADTSALYALMDEDDVNHRRARECWRELLTGEEELRASSYVVVEAVAVLQRRLGMEAVRAFLGLALPSLEVEWVTPETHRAALSSLLVANRRDLSLIDCVSFEGMRQQGVQRAFTFDPHFAEQGFECVPAAKD